MAELDKGAASVYIGVDPCYQNYASETEMPIVTPREVEALIANGTLEVVRVEDAEGLDNVGVISGSEESDLVPVVTEPQVVTESTEPVTTTPASGETQEPAFSDF